MSNPHLDAPASQQPAVRSRDDASRGTVRSGSPAADPARRNGPIGADNVRRPDATGQAQSRTYSTDAATPAARQRQDVTRSISRPPITSDRINGLENRSDNTRSSVMSRADATGSPIASDRSVPVSRTRDEAARSIGRPDTGTNRVRPSLGETRSSRVDDVGRATRLPITRGPADSAGRAGGSDQVRSINRSEAGVSRAADSRVQAARVTGDSAAARTVARGSMQGREMFVRANSHVSNSDVRVMNVGHHEFHGEHHDWDDRHEHHGDWDSHHVEWWRPHHDEWWHHGDWHHVDVAFSFTFVHSYFAPANAVVYDVVPVAPVVVAPAPIVSMSFAYYSHPAVVSVSSVRYVYPVAAVAPAVVVYNEYVAPPIITPVVFTPVVTTPVVAAPVVVPVVAPVYAPVYYYYPAYSVLSYPTYYVEPAPVVAAAPAVVEAPSSAWSISTAFGFGHHGKSFAFGGTFTKVNSAPVVAAAPVAAVPAVAVESVPVEAAPEASTNVTGGAAGGATADAVDTLGSATVDPAPNTEAGGTSLEAGLAAIRGGDMEQARKILSQVVMNDPNDGMSRMLYATALMGDGQYKDAAEAVRRGLATWQDLQLKDYYLPSVFGEPKRFTQAMRDAREFLSDHPERVDAWLLVSYGYAFSGDVEQAQSLLSEAQKTWPDDPSLVTLQNLVQAG